MLLQIILILTFHSVWPASDIQCFDCSQTFNLTSSEMIQTNRTECGMVNAPYSSCSQLLHVRYEKKEASVVFKPNFDESLVLSNAARMMTNTTMIWLDDYRFERIFQIFCFNNNACKADTISHIYAAGKWLRIRNSMFFECSFYLVRSFRSWELLTKLSAHLYDATLKPENLICADDQDKPTACPYGFCQLISSDSSSFSRSCVHNGSIPNPYGVTLESKTISETHIATTVMYTCNTPMCNNSTMAKEVRHLLEAREILIYSMTTTTTVTTTITTTSIAPTKKASTGNTVKPMISIQCGLIFLITFVFQ